MEVDLSNLRYWCNDKFYPLMHDTHRYMVLMGGGGSGKSHFCAQKIVYRMLADPGIRILVVRKVKNTIKESVFTLLRDIISEWELSPLFKYNMSDYGIMCVNGSQVITAGLDDVEKLKSIHKVSVVWVEEATECDLADIRQLDIRMRGKSSWYKQMMISFNPISVTHWLKKEFFDIENPDVITCHSTYRDNHFLDAEQIKVLESFKKTDPYYYAVYCLGEWGVIGRTVFDPTILTTRMAELRDKPYHIGRIEKDKLIADSQGWLKVFKKPEYGKYYVIGIDVAEGLIDGDYDAAVVLDNTTLEQVATFHGHLDVDLYAEEMYKLGRYYNDALLLPECNFNPGLVINLEKMQYPKIYMRQVLDDISNKIMMKHGWKTTKINRMTILSNLIEYVRDYPQLINDLDILDEMLTFTRNDRGRMEATSGAHDDLVLAHALALEAAMCGQQSKNAFREKGINYNKLYKMPQDIIDDWENGNQKTRELMAQALKLYA